MLRTVNKARSCPGKALPFWAKQVLQQVPATGPCLCHLSRFKIYTKTGDSGTSSLYDGTRLPKDSDFFKALGEAHGLGSRVGQEVACVSRDQVQLRQHTLRRQWVGWGSRYDQQTNSQAPCTPRLSWSFWSCVIACILTHVTGDVDEVNCVLGLAREFQTPECQPVGEQVRTAGSFWGRGWGLCIPSIQPFGRSFSHQSQTPHDTGHRQGEHNR